MIKGFEILDSQNTRDSLYSYHKKGAVRGVYLGFPILHEHYTMSLPGATEWTGIPQSGKTEFLLELLLNTSVFYGWRHLLYVPDIGTKEEIVSSLIHKLTGKTFDKRYVNSNYISENEIESNLEWVLHHFKILHKTDPKAKITPYEFWDLAVELKQKESEFGGIQTATIDSWKDMKRYVGQNGESLSRDDLYLEDVLNYRNTLSELHKMHFHIVIHPLKTEKDAKGKRIPPTPYELKGGPTWYDMGKCQITVHRVDGSPNEVEIIITKAKPKSVAKLGKVSMFFDVKQTKFYWENNGVQTFANKNYIKPTGISIAEEIVDDYVPF